MDVVSKPAEFIITEVDVDYGTVVRRFERFFSSPEEASNWCKRCSFGGYFYYSGRKLNG